MFSALKAATWVQLDYQQQLLVIKSAAWIKVVGIHTLLSYFTSLLHDRNIQHFYSQIVAR